VRSVRVATIKPCTNAVVAIKLPYTGIARPDSRNDAISSAQRKPTFAFPGKANQLAHTRIEPVLEPRPSPALRQQQDPKTDLAKYEGAHGDFRVRFA
jgi:hypothetical protein